MSTSHIASGGATRLALLALLATTIVVLPQVTPPAAEAAGTPDLTLTKDMPAQVLAGENIPVSLFVENPTDDDGWNLGFSDVLPPGVSYLSGTYEPTLIIPDVPNPGETTLYWENLADLTATTNFSLEYTLATDASYDVGDTVTNSATACASARVRFIPELDPVTGEWDNDCTGSGTATVTTELVPFTLAKFGGEPEEEQVRGLHDNQVRIGLKIDTNLLNPTGPYSIDDYLPAAMEFLECGTEDNSGGVEEYPGSGPINPGNRPGFPGEPFNDCVEPSLVETVRNPPGRAPGVYTHVQWTSDDIAAAFGSASLGPGESMTLWYAMAIPMFANTMSFDGGTPPTTGEQGSNILNNNGESTRELEAEVAAQNRATASGVYAGNGQTYTDNGVAAVAIEDMAIQKGISTGTLLQGEIATFTLAIQTSEYIDAVNDAVIIDTIPDGLCPLGTGTDEGTPECDFAGEPEPSVPYTSAVENSDGTWTITWDLNESGLSPLAPSTDVELTYPAKVRQFYQEDFDDAAPVLAADSVSNTVVMTGTSVVDGVETDIVDDSAAGLTSDRITILKEVAVPPLDGAAGCGDGAGLLWEEEETTQYNPGDLACWRLTLTLPEGLDSRSVRVRDILPAGFQFTADDSWTFGPANTLPETDADFRIIDPGDDTKVLWRLGDADDFVDAGSVFQVVFSTRFTTPLDVANVDIVANLMKVRYRNSGGSVFNLRDNANTELGEAELTLLKGIFEITRGGATVVGPNPPPDVNVDSLPVLAGDVVTFQVTTTNGGGLQANDVEVYDVLAAGITCADVGNITNDGVCNPAENRIEWSNANGATFSVPPEGELFQLFYDVTVPGNVSAGTDFVNTAGVRSYTSETNTGVDFTYIPMGNIDPNVADDLGEPNTDPAIDTSAIFTEDPVIDKTQVTSLDEPGNDLANQATIGELVTYTIELELPEGLTFYDAVVTETLPARLGLVSAEIVSFVGATEPTLATAGNVVTATFDTPYVNEVGSDIDVLVIEVVGQVLDIAANGPGTPITNNAQFAWNDSLGNPATIQDAVTVNVVEPSVTVVKSNDDDNGIVQGGDIVTYNLAVSNAGGTVNSPAHDVLVVDEIPVGLTPMLPIDNDGVWDPDLRTITWIVDPVLPGATVDLPYTVVVETPVIGGADLINTVTIAATSMPGDEDGERGPDSPLGGPYTATDDNILKGPAATVSKTAAPSPLAVGEVVTYTLEATIPANAAFNDVTVIDSLPDGLVFRATNSIECAGCDPPITGSEIGTVGTTDAAWWFDDLALPGAEDRVIEIVYEAYVDDVPANVDTTTLTNEALLVWNFEDTLDEAPVAPPNPDDFDLTSDITQATVALVEPVLSLDKNVAGQVADADARSAEPGEVLTYEIIVTNTGTAPAYDVVISDTPDVELTDVVIAPTPGVVVTDDWTVADPAITWTVAGPVDPGATLTLTYVAEFVSSDLLAGGDQAANTAAVDEYWGVPEAERTNPDNADLPYRQYVGPDDTVVVDLEFPSVTIAKTTGLPGFPESGPAVIGTPFPWQITIANTDGYASAFDLDVTDVLPGGFTYDIGSATFSTIGAVEPDDPAATTLVWTDVIAQLGPGEEVVLDFTVTPQPDAAAEPNPHVNVASAVADDGAGDPGNADGPYETGEDPAEAMLEEPELTLVKTTGGAGFPDAADSEFGAQFPWRIEVTNVNSQATAFNVDITDVLPPNHSYDAGSAVFTAGGAIEPTSITEADTGDTLVWVDAVDVGPLETVVLEFTATIESQAVEDPGVGVPHTNTSSAVGEDPGGVIEYPADPDTAQVTPYLPEISIDKTTGVIGFPDVATAEVGVSFPWRVVVTNDATVATAYGVEVVDTLPPGWEYDAGSATFAPGGALEPTSIEELDTGDVLTWSGVVDLGPGESITLDFTATPTTDAGDNPGPDEPHINSAIASATDAVGGNEATTGPDTAQADLILPDLFLVKTPDGDPAVAGAPAQYQILISNNGTGQATNLLIPDTLPAGVTYTPGSAVSAPSGLVEESVTPNPVTGETDVVWSYPLLAAGDEVTIVIPVDVDAPQPDGTVLPNSAEVTSDQVPTPVGDDAFLVVDSAPVWLDVSEKTSDPEPSTVEPDDPITYTMHYGNTGNEDATSVVVTDMVPEHSTFVTGSVTSEPVVPVEYLVADEWVADEPVDPTTVAGVRWLVGDVPVEAEGDVGFTVTVDNPLTSGTLIVNSALLQSDQTPEGVVLGPVEHDVVSAPILGLEKAVDFSVIDLQADGDILAYDLVLENTGNAPATIVTVTDAPPEGTVVAAVDVGDADQVECSVDDGLTFGACDGDLGLVTQVLWTWASITTFEPQSVGFDVQIQVPIASGTVIPNTATQDSEETEPGDSNEVVTEVLSVPVLTLDKTVDPEGTVAPGDVLTYTMVVENLGSDTANNVVLTDVIPDLTTYVAGSASDGAVWIVEGEPRPAEPRRVDSVEALQWTLVELGPGGIATFTFQVELDATIDDGTVIPNTATLVSDDTDPLEDSVENPVESSTTIAIQKTTDTDVAEVGDLVDYEIVVTVDGNQAADPLVVTDELPPQLLFVAADMDGVHTGGIVTWDLGRVEPGTSIPLTVTVEVAQDAVDVDGLLLTNTAVASAPQVDEPVDDSVEILIAPPPDLPATGVELVGLLMLSLSTLAAGFMLLALARPRRRRRTA